MNIIIYVLNPFAKTKDVTETFSKYYSLAKQPCSREDAHHSLEDGSFATEKYIERVFRCIFCFEEGV